MSNFLKEALKSTGNKYANIVEDGVTAGDFIGFVDTGSYTFNALLCGSIYGGSPNGKILGLAGETGVGKTYFMLSQIYHFLKANPTGAAVCFETESAMTKDMIVKRGIDPRRMAILPVSTIQEFRTQACRILDDHLAMPEKERIPLFFGLDSLGNISTTKEIEDVTSGSDKKDMTRAQLIKATFRVLTLRLGLAKIPMIVTNHTYSEIGTMYPKEIMNGGRGLYFAASNIVFLTKSKEKDGTDVVGNTISLRLEKGRLTKENSKVKTQLFYERGLDRYFGLIDIGLEAGIFEKSSTKIKMPDGTTHFEKHIYSNPEKYFTKDILDRLDAACKEKFLYGTDKVVDNDEELCDNDTEEEIVIPKTVRKTKGK